MFACNILSYLNSQLKKLMIYKLLTNWQFAIDSKWHFDVEYTLKLNNFKLNSFKLNKIILLGALFYILCIHIPIYMMGNTILSSSWETEI